MPQNCPFDITPLSQSQSVGVPQLNNLNFTNQDFWSMKSRLITFIQQQFPNDFNDFIESSLAILLIENFAFCADLLSFKIDQISNEVYIDTVTELDNAFRLAALVGYQPTPPISSICNCSATINQVLSVDLIIPAGLSTGVVSQGQTITFELYAADSNNNPIFDEDIIIPAGNTVNSTIVGVQRQTIIDNFTGSGTANQSYTLTQFPVIFDSVIVQVNGVTWTQVDVFTSSTPMREFRVSYDSTYTAFVIFGNNIAGLAPSVGAAIQVSYGIGGGVIGNIITGALTFQRNVAVQGLDFNVAVNFVNYTSATNGYNGDQVSDIQQDLPSYLKTQNRAVTGEDYQTLSSQFVTPYNGQIGASTAVLRNYGCAGNIVDIFVLQLSPPSSLIPANDVLKVMLYEQLQTQKMLTDFVCIRDGVVLLVEVVIDLTVSKNLRSQKTEITALVNLQVNNFFALANWAFGQTLKNTDLLKALASITQVNQFDISFLTTSPNNQGAIVTTKYYEIIRPDTITLNYVFE